MDNLFNELTLSVIAIIMVTAVFAYSVTAIPRNGSAAYLKAAGNIFSVFGKAMSVLATTLISFLASGTRTSDSNEASENAARGGVLNYRTGKFDDGTDAGGWYEKD